MNKTLLFGNGVSERLVDASKFGLVLLFELRCLLFVILFLCVKLLLKLSVLGLINQRSLGQLGRMGGRRS